MGSSLFDALNPLRKMVDGRSGWFIYISINLSRERGPLSKVSENSTAGFHFYVLIPKFEVLIPTFD